MADARIAELRKGFQEFSSQIVTQVEGMRRAFNQNHKAYAQAFAHVDMQLNVLQAVINDLVAGKTECNSSGGVDWAAYRLQYEEYLKEQIAQAQEATQAADGVSAEIVRELQEEVFGGDYGSRTQAGGDREVPELGSEGATSQIAAGDGQGGPGDDVGEGAHADEVPEVSRDDGADEGG